MIGPGNDGNCAFLLAVIRFQRFHPPPFGVAMQDRRSFDGVSPTSDCRWAGLGMTVVPAPHGGHPPAQYGRL